MEDFLLFYLREFCVVLFDQIFVRFCQVMIFVPHVCKPNGGPAMYYSATVVN